MSKMKPIVKEMWTCERPRDIILKMPPFQGEGGARYLQACTAQERGHCLYNAPSPNCRPITITITKGHDKGEK